MWREFFLTRESHASEAKKSRCLRYSDDGLRKSPDESSNNGESTVTTANSTSDGEGEQYSQPASQRPSSLDNARMTLSYVKRKMKKLEQKDGDDGSQVRSASTFRMCSPRTYSTFRRPEINVSRHEMHLAKKHGGTPPDLYSSKEERIVAFHCHRYREGEDDISEDSLYEGIEDKVQRRLGSLSYDGEDVSCLSEYETSHAFDEEEGYTTSSSSTRDGNGVCGRVSSSRSSYNVKWWDRISSSSEDHEASSACTSDENGACGYNIKKRGRPPVFSEDHGLPVFIAQEEKQVIAQEDRQRNRLPQDRALRPKLSTDLQIYPRQVDRSFDRGDGEDSAPRNRDSSLSYCISRMKDLMLTVGDHREETLPRKRTKTTKTAAEDQDSMQCLSSVSSIDDAATHAAARARCWENSAPRQTSRVMVPSLPPTKPPPLRRKHVRFRTSVSN